jgi:hypothetical protein
MIAGEVRHREEEGVTMNSMRLISTSWGLPRQLHEQQRNLRDKSGVLLKEKRGEEHPNKNFYPTLTKQLPSCFSTGFQRMLGSHRN